MDLDSDAGFWILLILELQERDGEARLWELDSWKY
jgi:hypothetical protein